MALAVMAVTGIIFLVIGMPIAFALGLSAILAILIAFDSNVLIRILQFTIGQGTNFVFMVIPLFIFMGELIGKSGIGEDVFNGIRVWLSKLRGSLAISAIIACAAFASISGSSPATAATIGTIAIPYMLKAGYDKRLATGSVAAGGTLGILIPPSITMVIYGLITETSIGDLFLAGIIPGIFMAFLMSLYIFIFARNTVALEEDPTTYQEKTLLMLKAWPVLVLFVIVIGTIYTGIATVNEAAGVGAAGAIAIVTIRRRMTFDVLRSALRSTIMTSSMIFFLLVGANSFGFFIESTGVIRSLVTGVVDIGLPPMVILILAMTLFVIMGTFLDAMGILVLSLPIVFPILSGLGYDPVWIGVLVTITAETAMITPPLGLNLFVLKSISPSEVGLNHIIGGSMRFVLVMLIAVGFIIAFPQIALWLPENAR
jgi:C4-dicarboxylate transporter DctM subunit